MDSQAEYFFNLTFSPEPNTTRSFSMSIQNMRVSFSFNKGAVTLDSVNFLLCSPALLCKSIFPFEPMIIWYWKLLSREFLVRRTETLSLAVIISGNLVLCKRYRFDLLLFESFTTSQIVSENTFEMMFNKVVPKNFRVSAENSVARSNLETKNRKC